MLYEGLGDHSLPLPLYSKSLMSVSGELLARRGHVLRVSHDLVRGAHENLLRRYTVTRLPNRGLLINRYAVPRMVIILLWHAREESTPRVDGLTPAELHVFQAC